jgi:hypothetical protein
MKKPIAVLTATVFLFALSYSGDAQQPAKVPRIGFVSVSGDTNSPGSMVEAFRMSWSALRLRIASIQIS